MLALPGKEQQIMKKLFSLKYLFAAPQREQYYINISFPIIFKRTLSVRLKKEKKYEKMMLLTKKIKHKGGRNSA